MEHRTVEQTFWSRRTADKSDALELEQFTDIRLSGPGEQQLLTYIYQTPWSRRSAGT
jgi:hypothetical protein